LPPLREAHTARQRLGAAAQEVPQRFQAALLVIFFGRLDSIHLIMGASVQQQHRGMTAFLLIHDAQVIAGADGTQPAQLPGQPVVLQHGVKGLIHEERQRRLHPPLVTHRQSGKGLVEPVRGP